MTNPNGRKYNKFILINLLYNIKIYTMVSRRNRKTQIRVGRHWASRYRRSSVTVPQRRQGSKLRKFLPVVLPDKYMCKLRYASRITMTPSITSDLTSYIFRANDLYDPDYAYGGHQPKGFDQLCLFWNHFTVLGSKIKVSAVETTGNTNFPYYFSVATVDAPYWGGKNLGDYLESEKHSPMRAIGMQASQQEVPAKAYFSLKKFFNSPNLKGNTTYQCDISSSPAEVAYYELVLCRGNAVAGLPEGDTAKTFLVEIEYIVSCHEPKELTQS